MKTRNSEVLASFVKYCEENPDMRFWQALKNWSGWGFVLVTNKMDWYEYMSAKFYTDTYNWEGKDS